MSSPLDPPDRRSLGSTFKRIIRRLTMPSDAVSGQIRMVWGADTPPELQSYGITVAMLAYVTDFNTGIEVGYFFIGVSNRMDTPASRAMVYGNVTYPTPGQPGSAGVLNVKTNFQQDMFAQFPLTIYKDQNVEFWYPVTTRWYSPNHSNWAEVKASDGTPSNADMTITAGGSVLENLNLNFDQLFYNGLLAPAGLKSWSHYTANFGPINTETVWLTSAAVTWKAGHAYEVIMDADIIGNIGGNTAFFTLRRGTNILGAILGAAAYQNHVIVGETISVHKRWVIRNDTGVDITDRVVVTVQPSFGGGGTVTVVGGGAYNFLEYVEIRDLGGSANYPDASQI